MRQPSHEKPRAEWSRRRWLVACTILAAVLRTSTAEAYRPFDSTDADVAEPGVFELELGPVHWYDRAGQHSLLAPVTVLNFGILPATELVLDFQGSIALGPLDGRSRTALLGTDVMVKHVLRDGSLQGKAGPSIALEVGILTPEINGTDAFGAAANLIFSFRSDWGTVHFNERPGLSRKHQLDVFSGVVVEGPRKWRVRPVSEMFFEREFGVESTASALVGAIWSAHEGLSFDAGLRAARIGAENAAELRLGLTWSSSSSESARVDQGSLLHGVAL